MRQRKLAALAAFSAAACVLASIAGWSQTKDECASINRAMPVMTQGLDEMNSAVEKLTWDDIIAETSGAMKAAAKDAAPHSRLIWRPPDVITPLSVSWADSPQSVRANA